MAALPMRSRRVCHKWWSQACKPISWPSLAADRITWPSRRPMRGPGHSVPRRRMSQPYRLAARDRSILSRNVGRSSRRTCRPMLSGPTEKKKVALRPRALRILSRVGTPSRVPRKVSTSTRSPRLQPGSATRLFSDRAGLRWQDLVRCRGFNRCEACHVLLEEEIQRGSD